MGDVLGKTARIAAKTKPFEMKCIDIAGFDPWNQCLVAVIERSADLDKANVEAQKLLKGGDESVEPIFPKPIEKPHASIIYTNFESKQAREEAISWAKEEAPWILGFK